MAKKQTDLVLVETVSIFRHRYVVEVPLNQTTYALDTVTMNEAVEFSQEHIDENIITHRIITEKEALALCDIDNDYAKDWTKEQKIQSFFTLEKK